MASPQYRMMHCPSNPSEMIVVIITITMLLVIVSLPANEFSPGRGSIPMVLKSRSIAYDSMDMRRSSRPSSAVFGGTSVGEDEQNTKVERNVNFGKLLGGYLFPEIGRRRNAYLAANPNAREIISLGIGDTTQPIPEHILEGLMVGASKLGSKEVISLIIGFYL